MNDKDKQDLPPTLDEVADMFFDGDSNLTKIDIGRGRPKKHETTTVDVDKQKALTKKEQEAIAKQIRFLKKYEERQNQLEQIQVEGDLDRKSRLGIKKKLRDEIEKKKKQKPKNLSYLAAYKSTVGCQYAENGQLKVLECQHEDVIDGTNGSQVISKCKKCSRMKIWTAREWQYYLTEKLKMTTKIENPDPTKFNF